MDFKEIEDLNKEDIMNLYDDIMEFGDDTRLADCCCDYGRSAWGIWNQSSCKSWCRGQSSSCSGWDNGMTSTFCPFSC